jgi:HEPN domain-containing protein
MDITNFHPPTEHAKINALAIRCFRDTGDGDYIAARLAMRARLAGQFLWSSEQAIEKYLKCILMLNRRKTSDLSHDIGRALERINNEMPFRIDLSNPERQVFVHVAEWDADRYLIGSFHLMDQEVCKLDMLVWRLRQYCVPLDVVHYADAPSEDVLIKNIKRIEAGLLGPAKNGHLPDGLLEKILADKVHAARGALVWKNFRYSGRQRKSIGFSRSFQAINSPLYLNPELADEAARWMKIPKSVVEACRNLVKERQRDDA